MVEAYHKALQSVELWGPTNAAPIIHHVANFAEEAAKNPDTQASSLCMCVCMLHVHVCAGCACACVCMRACMHACACVCVCDEKSAEPDSGVCMCKPGKNLTRVSVST